MKLSRAVAIIVVIVSTARAQTTMPAEFRIDQSHLAPAFVGFGAHINGWLYCKPNWGTVTDENVKNCERKFIDLAPQHVRIFVEIDDASPQQTDPQINESVMRTIALAQRAGATVNLTMWHGPYTPKDGAERMTKLLDDAINKRKLTAVQYVTLQNEPNSFNMNKEKYNALYREFDAALRRAGLRDKIKIIGGDLLSIDQAEWFKNLADNLADVCDGYSVHMYSPYWNTERLLHRIDEIEKLGASLPKDRQKPIYITEFGFNGHRGGSEEPGRDEQGRILSETPMYGVLVGWRLIDALDHGFVTMLHWDAYSILYDRDEMPYGMIGNPQQGWPLRPHYHLMRMFTHTAKPGWHALGVDGATDELRVAAMRGDEKQFTIYAVNRAADSRALTIDGALAATNFRNFNWNGDGKGLMHRETDAKSDENGHISLKLSPGSVVALTTLQLEGEAPAEPNAAARQEPRPPKAVVETITTDCTPWCSSTWGYNTPKILFDGKKLFAVAMVGTGIHHDFARLYWRDAGDASWHRGADVSPVYQPATILLDDRGHINIFSTELGERGYHWRSAAPGDVTKFEPVDLPMPEKFAFGYLGVGRGGSLIALVGLDSDYSMWLATKPAFDAPWSQPVKIVESQKATSPWTSPVYPIVMPDERGVDVVFSNSPDGGVHNTYNRVEHVRVDLASKQVAKPNEIVTGPVGEMTFGLDAMKLPDGSISVLYLSGLHVYGETADAIEGRRGLFLATSRDGGKFRACFVTPATGTAQLHLRKDGTIEVFQSGSDGAYRYWSNDHVHWIRDAAPAWTSPGGFLYAIKPNSGSVDDGALRAIQTVGVSEGKFRLESIFAPEEP